MHTDRPHSIVLILENALVILLTIYNSQETYCQNLKCEDQNLTTCQKILRTMHFSSVECVPSTSYVYGWGGGTEHFSTGFLR